MLLCISCHIPACRKVCGFLGHNAHLPCSTCMNFFNGNVSQGFDFSGYVTSSWRPQDNSQHRVRAKTTKLALTKAAKNYLESRYGLCYTVLLELPYLNIVRQHVVDPMHNLFLGIATHALCVWKDTKLLSAGAFEDIQKTVDCIQVSSTVGRIPAKIASGFAELMSAQWKNWISIYSRIALQNHLSADHLTCCKLFVNAWILFLLTKANNRCYFIWQRSLHYQLAHMHMAECIRGLVHSIHFGALDLNV